MSKYITVSLDKRGVSCVAKLLDDVAPRTCAAVWDALPLSAPGVNATEMEALPRVTPVIVGGSGTAAGMTGSDGGEALLVPNALVAVTVQV